MFLSCGLQGLSLSVHLPQEGAGGVGPRVCGAKVSPESVHMVTEGFLAPRVTVCMCVPILHTSVHVCMPVCAQAGGCVASVHMPFLHACVHLYAERV